MPYIIYYILSEAIMLLTKNDNIAIRDIIIKLEIN